MCAACVRVLMFGEIRNSIVVFPSFFVRLHFSLFHFKMCLANLKLWYEAVKCKQTFSLGLHICTRAQGIMMAINRWEIQRKRFSHHHCIAVDIKARLALKFEKKNKLVSIILESQLMISAWSRDDHFARFRYLKKDVKKEPHDGSTGCWHWSSV